MSQFFQSSKKWGVYDNGDFTFLQKNFVHDQHMHFDIRYRNDATRIQIEQVFKQTDKEGVSSSGEVKFQLPMSSSKENRLYSRLTTNGKCTFAYDDGLLELTTGAKLNFFGAFQTNRSFNENVYKFGLACLGQNYNYACRFRFQTGERKQNDMVFHFRGSNNGQWHHGRWRFNFFSIYDPSISKLIKNGLLLGLFLDGKGEDSLFLRVESGKKQQKGLHWCEFFRQLKFNWSRTWTPTTKVGFETKIDFTNWEHLWSDTYLGAEWKFPEQNTTVKARISPNLTSAFTFTHRLGTYGSYSLGLEVRQLGKQNAMRFGTKLELNLQQTQKQYQSWRPLLWA